MLPWRSLTFLLLITLEDFIVKSQPPNTTESSSTTFKPGEGGIKPLGAFSPDQSKPMVPLPGPKPFPNDPNRPNMPNMPIPMPPMPPGCKTVTGTWYNEVGSRLVVTQSPEGGLTGSFYTLRQSEADGKKAVKATVIGGASFIGNTVMLGFTVSWGMNGSTTAWTGQCYLCGNDEIIETNWLMREPVNECLDRWHANRFGHSTFRKTPPAELDPSDIADKDDLEAIPPYHKPTGTGDSCNKLEGVWFNELGAKLDLIEKEDGAMEGVYELPAMIKMMKSAKVSGVTFYKIGGTFGFMSLNEEGRVVTAWVGQCLVCNKTEMLDTYVSNRLWVPTCLEEFRTTAYGANRFTRENMAPPIPQHPGFIDHPGPNNHQAGMNQGGMNHGGMPHAMNKPGMDDMESPMDSSTPDNKPLGNFPGNKPSQYVPTTPQPSKDMTTQKTTSQNDS